jgi:hypothetical protein
MKRWITILGIIAVELIAAMGAMPLFGVWNTLSFWDISEIALPSFVMLTVAGTVLYTRRESKLIRIIAPITIAGALLLTVAIVTAFT